MKRFLVALLLTLMLFGFFALALVSPTAGAMLSLASMALVGVAVTDNQSLTKTKHTHELGIPIKAGAKVYHDTLVIVNAGFAQDAEYAPVAGDKFGGIATSFFDNSTGQDGDLQCEVIQDGKALLSGSGFTQAIVGDPAFAIDNFTVATAGDVLCGKFVEYVSATEIWVEIKSFAS